MVDLIYCLTIFLFFDTPLLYYYINLNLSIIICLFSGGIYPSFDISISVSSVFKAFCEDFFETPVILSRILLPIKSPAVSAVL